MDRRNKARVRNKKLKKDQSQQRQPTPSPPKKEAKYYPSGRKISTSSESSEISSDSDSDSAMSQDSDSDSGNNNNSVADKASPSPSPANANASDSDSDSEAEAASKAESAEPVIAEDEQEDMSGYRRGGYHPVQIGEVYNRRYKVIRKLGWGQFSTVWLCLDQEDDEYVALKIVKSEDSYRSAAEEEVRLLNVIQDADPNDANRERIVELRDHFVVNGRNGTHVCMVMEAVGPNLLSLVEASETGIPIQNVRTIVRQILEGLHYLHGKARVIHTDIKPENLLLKMPPEHFHFLREEMQFFSTSGQNFPKDSVSNIPADYFRPQGSVKSKNMRKKEQKKAKKQQQASANGDGGGGDVQPQPSSSEAEPEAQMPEKPQFPNPSFVECEINCKIADLGNACAFNETTEDMIQTRQYRSVEAILGSGYNSSADIWSLACLAFELATGDYLFDPHAGRNQTRDDAHLGLMQELLGKIPLRVAKQAGENYKDFFDFKGKLKRVEETEEEWTLASVLRDKYKWDEESAEAFASFLLPMLNYDKDARISAAQALAHPWLQSRKEVVFGNRESETETETETESELDSEMELGSISSESSQSQSQVSAVRQNETGTETEEMDAEEEEEE